MSGEGYSREDKIILPNDDTDLETHFSIQDYADVATDNNVYVSQSATGQYATFLFKDILLAENNVVNITCKARASIAPSSSTVYLQIYNRNLSSWETKTSNSVTAANVKFTMSYTLNNLSDYKDINGWIACRVYQEATA